MRSATTLSRRLHHDVVETIVGRIVSGELQPGSFLPAEPEMSSQLGVSRTVIREALRVLAGKGLIEVRHGSGTHVTDSSSWDPLDAQVLAARRERGAMVDVLAELVEARRIFECEVAALAAKRCRREHLEALKAAIDRMERAGGNSHEFMLGDAAFHRILVEATANPVLRRMLEPIQELIQFSMQMTDSLQELLERALAEHKSIYRAVRRGDAEGARRAMRRHLAHTERDIRNLRKG
jgi:GntR family galactonate operon transcriptional repressor